MSLKLLILSIALLVTSGCATTYVTNIGVRKDNIEKSGGASYVLNTYKTPLSGGESFDVLVDSKPANIAHESIQEHLASCKAGDLSSFSIDGADHTYRYMHSEGACVASRKYKKGFWYPAQILQPIALAADVIIVPFTIVAFIFTL